MLSAYDNFVKFTFTCSSKICTKISNKIHLEILYGMKISPFNMTFFIENL